MRTRTKRQLERFFLLTGAGCVLLWGVSVCGPAVYQDWSSWAFDQKLRHEPENVGAYLTFRLSGKGRAVARNDKPVTPSPPRSVPQPSNLKTGSLLGRLEIPRLHLSSMVREGAGETTLAVALGHIPGTALPGQKGNVGVAGHRDKLFRGLKDIQKDDVVEFQTDAGTYSYRVEGMQIVTPRDVGVLKPGPDSELTLVTCYPFYYVGPAPKRYIVKAREVVDEPSSPVLSRAAVPARKEPIVTAQVVRPKPISHKINPARTLFAVSTNHTQQLAPGVSIGLMQTDVVDHRLRGWVWLAGQHRTIWLYDRTPVRIYGALDGRTRVLVITGITRSSISGYLAPATT